ncbi:MAG: hypothetical protein INR62_04650, partial [Rhodospirillales bacterium]|nr:hypothetical protein [Acetobacter sp.]
VAASREGQVPALAAWEAKNPVQANGAKKATNALDEWAENESIRQWAQTDPPLAEEDLRPYILITRDRRNPFAAASSENAALVERLLSSKLVVAGMSKEIKEYKTDLAIAVFDEIIARIRAEEEYAQMPAGAAGMAELAKAHPTLQPRLLAFAGELPTAKLGTWILGEAGWEMSLANELKPKWKELLTRWAEQGGNTRLQKGARALLPLK